MSSLSAPVLPTTPQISTPIAPVPAAPRATGTPVAPGSRTSASASRLSRPADPAAVMKAAKDFEAMAIGQLLQPMFDTADTSRTAFGGGAGEAAWRPMLVQEIAKQITSRGGLGLAKPVYDAMLRMQETKSK